MRVEKDFGGFRSYTNSRQEHSLGWCVAVLKEVSAKLTQMADACFMVGMNKIGRTLCEHTAELGKVIEQLNMKMEG